MKTESGTAEATDSLCAHTLLSPKRLPGAPRILSRFPDTPRSAKIQPQPRLFLASPPSPNPYTPLSCNCVSHQPPSVRMSALCLVGVAEM